jgi:hypothetical protein
MGSSIDGALVGVATCKGRAPLKSRPLTQHRVTDLHWLVVFYQLQVNFQPILQKFLIVTRRILPTARAPFRRVAGVPPGWHACRNALLQVGLP